MSVPPAPVAGAGAPHAPDGGADAPDGAGGAGRTDAGRLPRDDGLPRTAAGVAVLSWSLAVLALTLHLASGVGFGNADVLFLLVDVTVAAVYGTVGAVLLSRRRHAVGGLVGLAGVGGGVSALGGAWSAWGATHPGSPVLPGLADAYGWAWIPGTFALFLVVPWLVRDHPLTLASRLGLAAGVATTLAHTAVRLLIPASSSMTLVGVAVVVGLVTAAAVAHRRFRGPAEERRGLGLLALGTGLMALSFVPLLAVDSAPEVVLAVPVLHLVCQALFPAALLVSVLRNRLWGLDLALSRATIAALLTLGLVGAYLALVGAVTLLVDSRPAAQLVAAVGVALAVQPLRTWLQRRVHRLVYGDGGDPGRAALRLGRQMSTATGEELLEVLVRSVGEALALESVRVTVRGAEALDVTWGVPTSPGTTLPVESGGRTLGEVAVTPRPGERLDARTRDALGQLLPVVASGVALSLGALELRRARDAVTRVRLEERRVIRREIHDGLGPWLTGLRLGLQGAINLLPRDPEAAGRVLTELAAEAEHRVQDVRSLSRSLLPPALDELGLEAALGELVARHAAEGFDVRLRCAPCTGLDPDLAAAAYAVAAEAVLNAARHSGTRTCGLVVDLTDDLLVVTCEDHGVGLAPDAAPGVGTRSMHERCAERGGTLERSDLGPGTRVRAVLPLTALVPGSTSSEVLV
ncbi:sensor histidine kinase [Actinotalea ferrariae]|uniref:sensor histidine kinase n=1 Tax=Actinotalea ferrariae TaxID=1386098 RepID=UPI001C8C92C7|nr:histidine kinase [Actinotalea ferrariae]